jgi:hypothetical protein
MADCTVQSMFKSVSNVYQSGTHKFEHQWTTLCTMYINQELINSSINGQHSVPIFNIRSTLSYVFAK